MKQAGIWTALVWLLYVLQSTVMPLLAFHSISTDYLLLFTVSFGFLHGSGRGAYAGFLVGILQDLATGTFFGISVFAKLMIGFCCGLFSNKVYKEQVFLLPLLAVMAASLVNDIIITGFMLLLGYSFDVLSRWEHTWPVILMYNALFALPVHYIVYRLFTYFSEKKQNG